MHENPIIFGGHINIQWISIVYGPMILILLIYIYRLVYIHTPCYHCMLRYECTCCMLFYTCLVNTFCIKLTTISQFRICLVISSSTKLWGISWDDISNNLMINMYNNTAKQVFYDFTLKVFSSIWYRNENMNN